MVESENNTHRFHPTCHISKKRNDTTLSFTTTQSFFKNKKKENLLEKA